MAEKEGKPVELLVVPAVNPFDALAQAANSLQGVAPGHRRQRAHGIGRTGAPLGLAWESLPEPRHPFSLEVISPDRPSTYVNLGPHPPRMWPEDVDLLHEIWLQPGGLGRARLPPASSRRSGCGLASPPKRPDRRRPRHGNHRHPKRTAKKLVCKEGTTEVAQALRGRQKRQTLSRR